MNEWSILQIEETADLAIIKKAYAALIKKHKPHEHPEMFKKIRAAYEQIIKSIEHGISLSNDNDEDSTQPVEQGNHPLGKVDFNPEIESSENIQPPEIEKFYIEYIIELYADLEKRNNVETWHSALQRNSTELLMSDDSFDLILAYIIRSEYLYHSNLPFKPEMYILLFDFFNVDEVSYISNNYSTYVSRPLLSMLSQHRYDLRLASIQDTDFNLGFPATQIIAENYYANLLCNSSDLIEGNIEQLSEYLRTSTPTYFRVLANVVFKDILDKYVSSTMQNDGRLVGQFYSVFNFKKAKKIFQKIFVQMGYSKEDIKNCLCFSKEMYICYVQPSLWYRIVMSIPPLRIIFGLLCWVYVFIKKSYFMVFRKLENTWHIVLFFGSLLLAVCALIQRDSISDQLYNYYN